MTAPTVSFANPATATVYRLVLMDDHWRITKVRHEHERIRLTHLRGRIGRGLPDAGAASRLVAGDGGYAAGDAEPMTMFGTVVLRDLDGTADVLTAIVREAQEVYAVGCRGFRPRSPSLREQRDRALATATAQMQAMGDAWRASGLQAPGPLPEWLAAALADGDAAQV